MSSTNKKFKPVRIPEDQKAFVFYSIRERISLVEWSKPNKDIHMIDFSKVEWNSCMGWDAVMKSGSTYFLMEAKNRDHYHTRYSDWIFEKKKFDCLMKELDTDKARQNGTIPLYINFFKNKVVGWDVSNLKSEDFEERMLICKTVNGSSKKEIKLVTQLLIKDALFIEDFETNKQRLNEKAMLVFDVMFPGNDFKL